MKDTKKLDATHEIYAYISNTNEPFELTDKIACRMYGDELYDAFGDCVGVCKDFVEAQVDTRTCNVCEGEGRINVAKNRHYEHWLACTAHGCDEGQIAYKSSGEKPGGKRWFMPDHNTTLLLREL